MRGLIDRIQRLLPWGAALLFVTGIAHLASVLEAPRFGTAGAFARIAALVRPGQVTVLPPASSPGSPLPFRDPAVTSALCRYDLAGGPVRIGMAAPVDGFAALSLHDRGGTAFYALTDQSAVDGRIELTLEAPAAAHPPPAAFSDEEAEPRRQVVVLAPSAEGYAEFDVIPRVGGPESARRALASVRCDVERRG